MRPSLRPTWLRQTSLLAWFLQATPHRVPRRIATTCAQNAAPIDLPKLIIAPGSQHHNSLPTFLAYAKRKNLPTSSAQFVGTHYEYTSALALMRLGFSLLRIGRRCDAGIDLIGHWVLAPLSEPLPVIIQCKARKITVSPNHIRELEGSFQGIPPEWKDKVVFGLLVTTKKATKGVLEALGRSRWPMGFVLVSREGLVQQFVWNRAASERGLEGVGVTVRHTPRVLLSAAEHEAEPDASNVSKKSLAKFKNAGTRRDIQLTWMGSPIFPVKKDLEKETLDLMRYVAINQPPAAVTVEKRPPGRPKGSKNKSVAEKVKIRPRGRPKGTKMIYADKVPKPRGGLVPLSPGDYRGRPKGSKTKKKTPANGT